MAVLRRSRHPLVAAVTFLLATAGCGSIGPTGPADPNAVSIVALGDSVPAGANCHCTPYPELTARLLTTSSRAVTATNDAVGGITTDGVLRQLQQDGPLVQHVRAAHVVEVEVGANDVPHDDACGTDVSCYAPQVPPLQARLEAIVRRIHQLTAGREVLVVLLDYWSVWLGGAYAQQQGPAYVTAVTQVTDLVNGAIRSTASATGSTYVDLRAAFKGPDYAYDETRYLSDDGDHPNAAGHEQIADAVVAVVGR